VALVLVIEATEHEGRNNPRAFDAEVGMGCCDLQMRRGTY